MDSQGSGRRAAFVTGAAGVVGCAVVERLQADGFLVAGVDLTGRVGDLALAVDVTDREPDEGGGRAGGRGAGAARRSW